MLLDFRKSNKVSFILWALYCLHI